MTDKTWCEMSKATLAQGVAESSAKPESGESLRLPEAAPTGALFGWTVRISEDLPLGMIGFFRRKGIETVFYTATVETLRALRNPFARIAEELDERMAETQSAKEAREKAAFESLLKSEAAFLCPPA